MLNTMKSENKVKVQRGPSAAGNGEEWERLEPENCLCTETTSSCESQRPNNSCGATDIYRFVVAQDRQHTYQTALEEIKAGKKRTHWMWFVFPQMVGLGKSEKSIFYGIANRDEAVAYLKHPVLRARLIEATTAVYQQEKSAYEIFGHDAIKLACCMKLFASVSEIPIFKKMLERYCWR